MLLPIDHKDPKYADAPNVEKDNKLRCEHCKKKFVTSKQLQKYPKHIQTCAFFSKFLKPLEQGISCLLCNNFTPNRTAMKIHIKSKHTKQELNEYVQNNDISFPAGLYENADTNNRSFITRNQLNYFKNLKEQFLNDEFSDVKILCNGETFNAHKFVLLCHSDFFKGKTSVFKSLSQLPFIPQMKV